MIVDVCFKTQSLTKRLSLYNSLEPYEFYDYKNKRHSVGETAVVQEYITDNEINVYS